MDDDDACEFRINEDYAKKYDSWRQKELLQKLKDKYGDVDISSSSSSESEDEDGLALTSKLEKDWLRTLSALKSKDPKIYQKDFTFYESSSSDDTKVQKAEKKKKSKPLYLKDYERNIILEKGGVIDEESSDDAVVAEFKNKPGYYEEQETIRKSFKVSESDSEDSSDDSELLTRRVKTKQEKDLEEEDYLKWLKGQTEIKGKQVGIELEPLKDYWNNPGLEDGEKFLKDYILNKRFIDDDEARIPTYDEIVDEGEGFEEEEKMIEKHEEFEHKYNFRFEEPDPEFIKSYPRQIEDTVRRKESKRGNKRQAVRDRKKMEKEKRKEEIKQLKNLKKKEILAKIDQLKEITGTESVGFTEGDLEEDFDPTKHDQLMQKMFDEEYYGAEEGDQKPEFPADEFIDIEEVNWDNWKGKDGSENWIEDNSYEEHEPQADDPNFIMDADYDPDAAVDVRSRKKKKRRSKFESALMAKKPVFNPSEKSFDEYLDEYYKLDCEDVIGDVPCRFKYRNVQANDFGLTVEEIMHCREKELNAWASVKKMSQYRTQEEEMLDLQRYRQKAQNKERKQRILVSLNEKHDQPSTSRKNTENRQTGGKKGKKKKKASANKNEDVIFSDHSKHSLGKSQGKKTKPVNILSLDQSDSYSKKKEILTRNSGEKHTLSASTSKNTETVVEGEELTKPKMNVSEEHGKKNDRKKKKRKLSEGKGKDVKVKTLNYGPSDSVGDSMEDELDEDRKKKRKKLVSDVDAQNINEKLTEKIDSTLCDQVKGSKEKRKVGKKKKPKKVQISDARLKAYGIDPRKFKYMKLDNFMGQK